MNEREKEKKKSHGRANTKYLDKELQAKILKSLIKKLGAGFVAFPAFLQSWQNKRILQIVLNHKLGKQN